MVPVYVAEDHPLRLDARMGQPEEGPPLPPRTHQAIVSAAIANQEHKGYKKDMPYKRTGVKELSPLAALPLFDLVWDVMMCMMHIIPGIWKRHIFQMFVGNRAPATPKPRKSLTQRENKRLMEDHKTVLTELRGWMLPEAQQKELDQRSRSLGGVSGWIRNNLEVCTHGAALNSHDWIQLMQSAGDYLLLGLFPEEPRKLQALQALLKATNTVLHATSAADSENREQIDRVKSEVTEALCLMEEVLPATELAVMLHIMLHVPDAVYRWNSVRNYWSFFGERSQTPTYPCFCLFFRCVVYIYAMLYTFLHMYIFYCIHHNETVYIFVFL